MSDLRIAAQQALEALENTSPLGFNMESDKKFFAARTALRAALAQQAEPKGGGNLPPPLQAEPAQEPVAYIHRQGNHWEVSERFLLDVEKARGWTEEPLYTASPQRKPLTDEEIDGATAQERDALLDHIYEYGTAAEGVLERIRKLCRAIARAHGIGEQP